MSSTSGLSTASTKTGPASLPNDRASLGMQQAIRATPASREDPQEDHRQQLVVEAGGGQEAVDHEEQRAVGGGGLAHSGSTGLG